VGTYTVVDSTNKIDTVMTFSVMEKARTYSVTGTVMEEPGVLTVIVPIPKAKVYLKTQGAILLKAGVAAVSPATMPYPVSSTLDSAITDANGKFSLANVSQGYYILETVAAGYQYRDVPIEVPPDTQVPVSLLKDNSYCTITGTVKTLLCPAPGTGVVCIQSPVAGCTVSVSLPLVLVPLAKQSAAIVRNTYTGVSDVLGKYTIDSIPVTYSSKTVTVSAAKKNYAAATKQTALFANSAVTVNFVLEAAYATAETTTVDGVDFIIAAEKSQYAPGETVKARYTVKNNSMVTVTFNFPSCCQYDMYAVAPPRDTVFNLYKSGFDCACPSTSQIVLASGASQTINLPSFTDSDTAGTLTITALLLGYQKSASSVTVPIVKALSELPSLKKGIEPKKATISYAASTKTLSLVIPRSQNVSVSAYVLNGQKISQFSTRKFLTAGTHSIRLGNAALSNGIIVFRVDGEGFSLVKRISLVEER
jgi:hypothetical protein